MPDIISNCKIITRNQIGLHDFDTGKGNRIIFSFNYKDDYRAEIRKISNRIDSVLENDLINLTSPIQPPITAGISPAQFSDNNFFTRNRTVTIALLALFVAVGFELRVNNLGAESLSEDEYNKLQTVQDFRVNGLSGRNGEHPFLMKGLEIISISAAERLNSSIIPLDLQISDETALRFPNALFGAFTALLVFLLASELFGREIGFVAAALCAVEPMAVGFDRIAKEDSLLLFFFLLASIFWLKGQSATERSDKNWTRYVWLAGAAFGAWMASKYVLHLICILYGYYAIFQSIPSSKWGIGRPKHLVFLGVTILTFVILSPTILLPDTWHEVLKFSSESRIGHDSTEFMGRLYTNQMSTWFAGVPWTFYFVFILVKTSLSTLALFLIGLPLLLRRKMGDGRFFIFFWAFFWFMPFTLAGGKFTRYFTVAEPLIFITAAVGFYFLVKWLSDLMFGGTRAAFVFQAILFFAFISVPFIDSATASPNLRLFTNTLGRAYANGGSYFPHDEFYDTSTRDIVAILAQEAMVGSVVAIETPALFEYYARKAGRDDLVFVSLSDKQKVASLKAGDIIVIARGRRYFSNAAYQDYLERIVTPIAEIKIRDITSACVYRLDEASVDGVQALAKCGFSRN